MQDKDFYKIIGEYGLLLDTSPLLLLTVGFMGVEFIGLKRTACLSEEQFIAMQKLIENSRKVLISPHTLAEWSNLSVQMPFNPMEHIGTIIELLSKFSEIYIPKDELLHDSLLQSMGVTDLVNLKICKKHKCLMVTGDNKLTNIAPKHNVYALNINWLS